MEKIQFRIDEKEERSIAKAAKAMGLEPNAFAKVATQVLADMDPWVLKEMERVVDETRLPLGILLSNLVANNLAWRTQTGRAPGKNAIQLGDVWLLMDRVWSSRELYEHMRDFHQRQSDERRYLELSWLENSHSHLLTAEEKEFLNAHGQNAYGTISSRLMDDVMRREFEARKSGVSERSGDGENDGKDIE